MNVSIDLPRIFFYVLGFLLITYSGYLLFRVWSHINIKTRVYAYMTEDERNRRSFKAGIASIVMTFGIMFLASAKFSEEITVRTFLLTLGLGVFTSPFLALAMIFRMHKELETYTKLKDDVVFLDQKKK